VREISLTRGKIALVSDKDYRYLMQWSWCAVPQNRKWRAQRKVNTTLTRYMHQDVARRKGIKSGLVDHIDENPLNNTRGNLRDATKSQNLHNRSHQTNSRTKLKGVWPCKQTGMFGAEITVKGVKYWIGRFLSREQAKRERDKVGRRLLGPYYKS